MAHPSPSRRPEKRAAISVMMKLDVAQRLDQAFRPSHKGDGIRKIESRSPPYARVALNHIAEDRRRTQGAECPKGCRKNASPRDLGFRSDATDFAIRTKVNVDVIARTGIDAIDVINFVQELRPVTVPILQDCDGESRTPFALDRPSSNSFHGASPATSCSVRQAELRRRDGQARSSRRFRYLTGARLVRTYKRFVSGS